LREGFFTMSVGFPDGVLRHYDVRPSSPEAFSLAKFLTEFPGVRDDCLRYRLNIPGDVYCSGLTLLHSFEPDFSLDWDHKGILSTFFIMGA